MKRDWEMTFGNRSDGRPALASWHALANPLRRSGPKAQRQASPGQRPGWQKNRAPSPEGATQTQWKLVPFILAAGMLLSCDRPKPEPTEVTPPKPKTHLPSPTPDSPETLVTDLPPTPDDSAPQTAPAVPLDTTPSNWEQQLAGKLPRLKPVEKARAIFALLPSLPESALASAAVEAVEKLPDADYPATALPVLINPETHGQVLSVLFADLLERPDTIALPALLTIAKNPDHPFAPSALDDLRLLLNADHDTDWPRWDAAIRAKLATGR